MTGPVLAHGGSLTWDELLLVAVAYALIMVLANAGRDRREERVDLVAEQQLDAHGEGVSAALLDVSHRYGSTWALQRIDLNIAAGSFVSVVGANGAGKTTLLEMLAGSRPTAGDVVVGGHHSSRSLRQLRALTGMVSHRSMLFPDLTVGENLRLAAELHGVPDAAHEAARALALVDLSHRASVRVGALSHGQRQRAAIARTLLHRPGVLLVDEPFSGMDLLAADRLARTLTGLNAAGVTIVMTCHDLALARRLSDRMLFLSGGRIVHDLDPESVPVTDLEARFRGLKPAAVRV